MDMFAALPEYLLNGCVSIFTGSSLMMLDVKEVSVCAKQIGSENTINMDSITLFIFNDMRQWE